MIHHTSHMIPHTSHMIPCASHMISCASHMIHHASHMIHHASHMIHHTSHMIPCASHMIPQACHMIPFTTHMIRCTHLMRYLASECLQATNSPLMMSTFLDVDWRQQRKKNQNMLLRNSQHSVMSHPYCNVHQYYSNIKYS